MPRIPATPPARPPAASASRKSGNKGRPLTVWVRPELLEAVRAAAARDRRNVSDFVRILLEDATASPRKS